MRLMDKRDFLVGGLVMAGIASGPDASLAQTGAVAARPGAMAQKKIPVQRFKTTKLFKAPGDYANALAVAPEGLWIGQQKMSGAGAEEYHLPQPDDLHEAAWLVDWNGKLLKTIQTESRQTSGMAYGDGNIWMMANRNPEGCFQTDMNSKTISHRQIPLGLPGQNGGGCHGAQWRDGKLWIVANRPRLLLRVDPKSWLPEIAIPIYVTPEQPRWHDITFDNDGNIWQVTGSESTSYKTGAPGLVKYDGKTGEVLMTGEFTPGSCDPHGLEFHNGALISCDAGIHPGWPASDSPATGYIFRIEPA